MRVYKILNQKEFTKKIFAEEVFDNFLLTECDISKDYSVFIDGRKLSEEEDGYVSWGEVRSLAFASVKGTEPPRSFKIVLKLSKENTANTLKALGIDIPGDTGLFLNFRYTDSELSCISGTSTTEFALTKDLENGWEKYVQMFFAKKEIEFEEM